jgi:hypothetical protein
MTYSKTEGQWNLLFKVSCEHVQPMKRRFESTKNGKDAVVGVELA